MVDFDYLPWQVLLSRLILATALGALIGQERERHEAPAGLRTHLLVSAGACIFTLVSIVMAGDSFDPGRVCAQIITGIGFLGAGTIIRHGHSIRGLTTAASIWAVAGVGMTAGIGWWEAGVAATILLYFGLTILKLAEQRWFPALESLRLSIEFDRGELSLEQLTEQVAGFGHEVLLSEVTLHRDTSIAAAVLQLEDVPQATQTRIIEAIAAVPGVITVARMRP